MPSFSLQAGLRQTKVRLELLHDPTLLLYFEKMKRGGISVVSSRHAQANMPQLPQHYQPQQPERQLAYWDANNLYGEYCSAVTGIAAVVTLKLAMHLSLHLPL